MLKYLYMYIVQEVFRWNYSTIPANLQCIFLRINLDNFTNVCFKICNFTNVCFKI